MILQAFLNFKTKNVQLSLTTVFSVVMCERANNDTAAPPTVSTGSYDNSRGHFSQYADNQYNSV